MATRYRTVHVKIWNDDKFPYVSDDCQLVFFHLLTTPMSSAFGLYKASIAGLADEKRWPVERYEKAFREALNNGFVKYDARTLMVYLPNFLEYNHPTSPNVIISWFKYFEDLPNCSLKNEFLEKMETLCKDLGKAFSKAFAKAIGNKEQEQDKDKEQDQEDIPVSEIINSYHSILPSLPRIRESKSIEDRIKVRWKENKERQRLDWWQGLFELVADSDFLMGRKTDWQCPGLGWIAGPKNLSKILNNEYRNTTGGSQTDKNLSMMNESLRRKGLLNE